MVLGGEDIGGRIFVKWAGEEGDRKAWREFGGFNDKLVVFGGKGRWGVLVGFGFFIKEGILVVVKWI